MAYTKQTWATGDTITAAKLNHMEDGIGGGSDSPVFLINITLTEDPQTYDIASMSADKTWSEITTAAENGEIIVGSIGGIIFIQDILPTQDNPYLNLVKYNIEALTGGSGYNGGAFSRYLLTITDGAVNNHDGLDFYYSLEHIAITADNVSASSTVLYDSLA